MSRKRLTREESRKETRRRLLGAAALSIARKGLAATSVEDIAARAGYTRGAFYSNFDSKSDLFVELLRLDHQTIQENLRKLLEAGSSGQDLRKQLTLLYAQRYRDDNNYVMWAEARLHAMRDAKFRQQMNVLWLEKREMIASFIEQFCKHVNMQVPGACAAQALATIALMDDVLYFTITMPNELSKTSAEAVVSNILTRMFTSSSF
ncbi:TetR/AcrR family transcriptional regulator [Paraburkholderia youngii]|uniref:AcrR family transcriptional regulator n=1 Tax=Paraburkholderia youngii TaxID=2782701 RepID=A0A7W8LDQ3_9BURK|nr:TetR/AcrR family transcriptional regulator [Paraburkholderia youngii]MBB5404778.1 AcrR family transcriptional regulator [Paraburkholderia youngii]NVI07535.1 TetR/AcrR family transcriptional regulator [Paraburkholderia youngii]